MKTLLQQCSETEHFIEKIKSMLNTGIYGYESRKALHASLNDALDRLENLWQQFGFRGMK
jgi:1,2-phenylacetyl-CoA epoxidase PaaB subunit